MTGGPEHLSAYALDALRTGGLADDRARAAREHLVACLACRRLEEQLTFDQREFRDEVLPRTRPLVRARLEAQQSSADRGRWLRLAALPLAPALALLVMLVVPRSQDHPSRYVAQKGGSPGAAGSSFRVVGRREGRAAVLRDGSAVKVGDLIRFLVGPRQAYVMIASIDGGGQAKVYVPYEGRQSLAVEPGRDRELPDGASIELDGPVGPERIFSLFSRQPLPASAVIARLQALAARGPAGIREGDRLAVAAEEQSSLLLEKVAP